MTEAVKIDIAERTKFLLIDTDARSDLREFWKILQPELRSVLDAFYKHIAQVPVLAKHLKGDQFVDGLKSAQSRHWEALFSGRFDEDYMSKVRTVGLTHFRIGLDQNWYMGGYCLVLNCLADIAVRRGGRKAARLMAAANKAVFLDMDLALSVYHDAYLNQQQEAQRKQSALIAEFGERSASLLESMRGAGGSLEVTAKEMAATAENTTSQATTVAAAAEEATSNVQTVAAAAEELSQSINEISRQVTQSQQISQQAVEEATRTNELVKGLSLASEKIGDVLKLISDIAGQTNLLALNATIEAARAGDAGKGFAVVAAEVKNLANQTARATEQISDQINSIQAATGEAVGAIGTITKTISHSNEIASAIAAAVEEQGAATQEIASNVQQAAAGTQEVAGTITRVQEGASATEGAADNVREQAGNVVQKTNDLDSEIQQFFAKVRAV